MIALVAVSVLILAAGVGTAVAQAVQRFSDVPEDHEAFDAIEWAASAGVTSGYDDGTFKPERPLSKRHALVFLERFYDDILGATESKGFTRADMMVLLKAINDGTRQPEPEAEVWIPSPENRDAEGRCAPAVVMGVYDWEICAWGVAADPEMSRSEMEALVKRVWTEVRARGKPVDPPTLTEGSCGSDALGCYLGSTHTIRLSTGFTLRTLLHELAHALVSENAAMRACADDWTHRQPQCSHGDWYRCAADALYVRYAGLERAGVCGTPPDLKPGDWFLERPFETEWGIVHAIASVPDTSGQYWLFVRCSSQLGAKDRELEVFVGLPKDADGDELRVVTRITGDTEPIDIQWPISESSDVIWWPGGVTLRAERWRGTFYMAVYYDDRDVDRTSFRLGDSPAVSIVRAACD